MSQGAVRAAIAPYEEKLKALVEAGETQTATVAQREDLFQRKIWELEDIILGLEKRVGESEARSEAARTTVPYVPTASRR